MTTRSQRQERRGAASMGLRTTAASGSKTVKNDARAPRDGRAYPESVEFKTTGNIYYRLNLDDLIKAARHAGEDQRMMLFGIEFTSPVPGSSWRYVVQEESDYLELIGRVRQLDDENNDLRAELNGYRNP